MSAYIDPFTSETWKTFRDKGANVTGFRETLRRTAALIQPGDMFVCYIVGISKWAGLLEVQSTAYEDSTPYFSTRDDPFTCRFKVKPIVVLESELAIPMKILWNQLPMCQNIDQSSSGWPYKLGIGRSLGRISDADVGVIANALATQRNRRVVFEVPTTKRRK